jgi:dihydrofolate reductase
MAIILVACTDIGMGIGDSEGSLLFDLPKDMAHFKSVTTGKHVVMGRKTWDSLPVKPLPKRKNYVLTNSESFEVQGKTKVLHSIDEVIQMSKSKDVYVIGGGEIYKQLIEHADRLIITHVHTVNFNARVFFPEISFADWKLVKVKENKADDKHSHNFTFATYERKKKQTQE